MPLARAAETWIRIGEFHLGTYAHERDLSIGRPNFIDSVLRPLFDHLFGRSPVSRIKKNGLKRFQQEASPSTLPE